jgi:hypothetical protein
MMKKGFSSVFLSKIQLKKLNTAIPVPNEVIAI